MLRFRVGYSARCPGLSRVDGSPRDILYGSEVPTWWTFVSYDQKHEETVNEEK
jgi:hypothetical protein